MNRDEFDSFKKNLPTGNGLRRLDDMNPFLAMRHLKQEFNRAATPAAGDAPAIERWAAAMDARAYRDRALTTGGVRPTLNGLLHHFAQTGREVWLPEDVYPFYWQAAQQVGLASHSFTTLPAPDFAPLAAAAPDAVILLTSPLSPLGRALSEDETTQLKGWLAQSPQRRLVLDTVYGYDTKFDTPTRALLDTGQCYAAHSLSKTWLERGVFGVLIAPPEDLEAARAAVARAGTEACAAAAGALAAQPDLPLVQESAFKAAWHRLTPEIRRFAPAFAPPQSGYFTAIKGDYRQIMRDFNTLVIPASVFGARDPGLAIVSCLAYIKDAADAAPAPQP